MEDRSGSTRESGGTMWQIISPSGLPRLDLAPGPPGESGQPLMFSICHNEVEPKPKHFKSYLYFKAVLSGVGWAVGGSLNISKTAIYYILLREESLKHMNSNWMEDTC